ncbi:AAA family ATPase [Brachyspira sp. SAP_772]|uniref:cytidylate kinase-like family protein n=1 Tax=Brachyspira sp. SAP_772 TaxID=2608385 RepID=UPI0012F4F992|nr:cytidylate kinase-like family protein [Brachyspira sp. SAP_772]
MDKKIIITISREFGSGGRFIGENVAKKLGIAFYDKAIIEMASDKTGFSPDYIKENEQKLTSPSLFNFAISGSYAGNMVFGNGESLQDTMFFAQSNVIKEIASKHSCVIVGRCADYVLEKFENCINVFIHSDMQSKINRAVNEYKLDSNSIEKILKDRDKLRAKHYNYYTGRVWGDARNYDACFNSDYIGLEKVEDIIADMAKSL